jgi:hypothetical protein
MDMRLDAKLVAWLWARGLRNEAAALLLRMAGLAEHAQRIAWLTAACAERGWNLPDETIERERLAALAVAKLGYDPRR